MERRKQNIAKEKKMHQAFLPPARFVPVATRNLGGFASTSHKSLLDALDVFFKKLAVVLICGGLILWISFL
jgi:hypothetical protein